MFELVHGFVPDISGKDVSNTIGQILGGSMMLEYLGVPDTAEVVMKAIAVSVPSGFVTTDLGGKAPAA